MGGRENIPLPSHGIELNFVLDNPTNPGNIGAIARTMLNFGLNDLRIIGPPREWTEETRNRAKHAQDTLQRVQFHDSWESCMEDVSLIIGTSGKREFGDKVDFRHFLLPSEMKERLANVEGRVAVVFGEEGVGLTQEQLRKCDLFLTIPTWEGYPILNLSHAVNIIAYEWFGSLINSDRFGVDEALPRTVQTDRLLDPELRRVMRESVKLVSKSVPRHSSKHKGVESTLQRVLMRSLPDNYEAHRIIGVLQDAALAMNYVGEQDTLWDILRKQRRSGRIESSDESE